MRRVSDCNRLRLGLVFAAGLLAGSTPAAAAPHGARLTYFGDPSTSMAISWSSDSAADVEVSYGVSPAALTQTATAVVVTQPAPLNNTFTAKLTGLTPGTTYYYRVAGHPAAPAAPFSFTTLASDPCAPFRFIVIGDNRQDLGDSANPTWGAILDETLAFSPAFYVNTGDMVLDGNTPTQWASFVDISEPGWATVPSILTMGNHDDSDENGEGAFYNQLYELPRNTDGVEDYYSVDIGPVHFISLNSQYSDPASPEMIAQVAWLQADLDATTQPWKIAFFHKAIYSRGNHHTGEENDGALNAAYVPIFDSHDVDVVFNGHSHNYERYAPSVGVDTLFGGAGRTLPAGNGNQLGAVLPDGATGTTYIVTGGAGALTTDIFGFTCLDAACTLCTGFNISCDNDVWTKDKDATALYEGKHNFMIVDVDTDTMTFETRTTVAGNTGGGMAVDSFSMQKTGFPACGGMPDAGPMPGVDGGSGGPDGGSGGTVDGGNGGAADADQGGGNVDGDKSGGCGCRTGGRSRTLGTWLVVVGLALALGQKRRRRA